jgi:hypothetical protein
MMVVTTRQHDLATPKVEEGFLLRSRLIKFKGKYGVCFFSRDGEVCEKGWHIPSFEPNHLASFEPRGSPHVIQVFRVFVPMKNFHGIFPQSI